MRAGRLVVVGLWVLLLIVIVLACVLMLAEILRSGEYERFGRVYERSSDPVGFWVRTIPLMLGTLMFGLFGVAMLTALIIGIVTKGRASPKVERYLAARLEDRIQPRTATLLDKDPGE